MNVYDNYGNAIGYFGFGLRFGGDAGLIVYPNARLDPFYFCNSFKSGRTSLAPKYRAELTRLNIAREFPGAARLLQPGEYGNVGNNRPNPFGNSATIEHARALPQQHGLPGVKPFKTFVPLANDRKHKPDLQASLFAMPVARRRERIDIVYNFTASRAAV